MPAGLTLARASHQRRALVVLALVLSFIDAGFSLDQVGRFQEVNPVLRPLLGAPHLFLLVKTLCAAAGLVALARFARARALLGLVVIAYLVLDGYWLWRVAH